MRALFFLCVLANLMFFSWQAGYIGPSLEFKREPTRLGQQIAPENIRVVNADEAKKIVARAPKSVACVEWSAFPQSDFERLQVALAALGQMPKFSTRKVDETAGWWVYVPPHASKAVADRKGSELKGLGVADFFVITEDGPNKFAISLGVFKTEEGAKNYVDSLGRRGVKNARAAERETRLAKTIVVFRDVDETLRAKLTELKKDFPAQEIRDCASEDRRSETR